MWFYPSLYGYKILEKLVKIVPYIYIYIRDGRLFYNKSSLSNLIDMIGCMIYGFHLYFCVSKNLFLKDTI